MIQSAVNFSTSDEKLVAEIAENIKKYACVWDASSDRDHNRSVITILGNTQEEIFSALRECAKAAEKIDLSVHSGAHPRVGSVDVVPIVPLRSETMENCVKLAHRTGKMFFEEFGIPVFFYEEACLKEENRYLENVRSSHYKTLDIGSVPHPKFGASCIGARCPLIAYNVNLNTDNVKIAKIIAKEIRDMRKAGNPLMYGVKSMGLYLEKQKIVQVTCNITRPHIVGVYEVYSYIEKRAGELGCGVLESELIGAMPYETGMDTLNKAIKLNTDRNYFI